MTPRPLLLRPDNFTPPSRTPWGGVKILRDYKSALAFSPDKRGDGRVGESWEISVEPDFPSLAELPSGAAVALAELLSSDPEQWLGRDHARRYGGSTPLLVKLLDAADDLSVQIHPTDDYSGLASGESGKPESWLVLEAEPGCGLYLGLADGVERSDVEAVLRTGGDFVPLMTFVPVSAGDFFRIDAGTVHAIGRGVTLVEPQFVAPGRRGVTYRFWDWNRRYDASGRADEAGKPRALHVDHALAVTSWGGLRGQAFVDSIRTRADEALMDSGSPQTLARTEHFHVTRLRRGGARSASDSGDATSLPERAAMPGHVLETGRLHGVTVVQGTLSIRFGDTALSVERGRSAVIPAALDGVTLHLEPDTDVCITAPGP